MDASRFSFIGAGFYNFTNARYSTIGGGQRNIIQSPTNECCSFGATISGGIGHNTYGGTLNTTTGAFYGVSGCCYAGRLSFIGGGLCNRGLGAYSTIGGGKSNTASGCYSTISGGFSNSTQGCFSTIGGGSSNIVSGVYSSILGGKSNCLTGNYSSIVGGRNNNMYGVESFIGGGAGNLIYGANTSQSSILGGYSNRICAYNQRSAIIGGYANKIMANAYNKYNFIGVGGENCICGGASRNTIIGGISNIIYNLCDTHIVGSNITADRDCTTFVNNLSIMNIPTSGAGYPVGTVYRVGAGLRIKY